MTEDTAVRWLHPTRTGGLSVLKSSSYDGLVPRNGTFVPDGSPGHSSKRQAPEAGECPDEHDRRTRRRTGVALRRTPYGGQGYRRPASPVTETAVVSPVTVTGSYSGSSSTADGLPTPPVVPTRAGGSHVSVRPPALNRPVHYERAIGEDTLTVFTPAGSNPFTSGFGPTFIGRRKTTTGRSARRSERSAPVRERTR